MITADGKLAIFEQFVVDTGLPKYARVDELTGEEYGPDVVMMKRPPRLVWGGNVRNMSNDFTVRSSDDLTISVPVNGGMTVRNQSRLMSIQGRSKAVFILYIVASFFVVLARKLLRRPAPVATKEISVEEFFKSVKNSSKELVVIKERAIGYTMAITEAKQCGQTALVEQLTDGLNAARMEAQCEAAGVTKFLEEGDVVSFYKSSKRGLRLDWVMNFVRKIPADVVAKKVRADELGLFDNYVVLHYDPEAKAYALTQDQIAAKKDPILFGVMRGRRLLYFIGDWTDDVCDLTLDKLAEAIGTGAVKTLGPKALPASGPYRSK